MNIGILQNKLAELNCEVEYGIEVYTGSEAKELIKTEAKNYKVEAGKYFDEDEMIGWFDHLYSDIVKFDDGQLVFDFDDDDILVDYTSSDGDIWDINGYSNDNIKWCVGYDKSYAFKKALENFFDEDEVEE